MVKFMDIVELRTKTGLSQSQFAKKFHLSLRTLQSWEQGIYKTPEKYLFLIGYIIDLENEISNIRVNL